MSVVERPRPAVAGTEEPPKVLFPEARRRRRVRRLVFAGVVLIMAVAIAVVVMVLPSGPPRKPVAHLLSRPSLVPVVNRAAFAGRGTLAFVSHGSLWVLDGSTRSLVNVRTPGLAPSNPTFSSDGRWLAFLASKEMSANIGGEVLSTVLSTSLWIARSDGSDAHPVTGITVDQAFGWSPRADLFAISVGRSTSVPIGRPTAIDVIRPGGSVQQLVGGTNVTSAVWSPDGTTLAVSTQSGLAATLSTYPVSGGAATVWGSLDQSFIVPAGWWPVWGIGYTTLASGLGLGGSGSADGSPFYTISTAGATPRMLGLTLENESTGPPTGTGSGWLAFTETTQNGGRYIWQGKQVLVCSPLTTSCAPIPHPVGAVTLDPIWSPSGSILAYVQAPASSSFGFPQQTVASWYGTHQIRLYIPSKSSAVKVGSSNGATVPVWSSNGTSFLYVKDDALWVQPKTGRPVEVAEPLYSAHWPTFYGQVPFSAQFAWSQSPANETACLSQVDPQC
jgi:WD40-like Beta Propeller Repeat